MEQEKVEMMPPQKTWFFRGADGKTFAVNEKEAFDLITNTSQWRRKDLKMVGMSDGTTYHSYVREKKASMQSKQEELQKQRDLLNKYIEGHDKLLFEEFASEDDPRVKRAKKLIAKLQKDMEPLENEIKATRASIVQEAFDAELKKAEGNMVMPQDFSMQVKAGREHQEFANSLKKKYSII